VVYTRLVIKVSGHLLSSRDHVLNYSKFLEYAECIKELLDKGHKVVSVVGGGRLAREFLTIARSANVGESIRDLIGIHVTRLNALLLASLLYPAAPLRVPSSLEELLELFERSKAVCMGGLQPGQSTTAVSALCAEAIKADLLLITTDVEGIYDKDPKKFPDARLKKKISINRLEDILKETEMLAGTYKLFDKVSLAILKRSKIPVRVIKGDKEIILGSVEGKPHGSEIIYE